MASQTFEHFIHANFDLDHPSLATVKKNKIRREIKIL